MATDLTLNYANFASLKVWNFAPLHVCIIAMLTIDPLNVWSSILVAREISRDTLR